VKTGRETQPCEADNCLEAVPSPTRFCKAHWALVADDLRLKIFDAPTPQERDDAVIEAVRRIRLVERKRFRRPTDGPHDPDETRVD
jgi:hypothetical protein